MKTVPSYHQLVCDNCILILNFQNLTESTELQDWSGEKVKAIHVCSSIIEYLTNLVRRRVAVNPMVYREQDLCYVLTVPATWTESNINFMRRAAEQVTFYK